MKDVSPLLAKTLLLYKEMVRELRETIETDGRHSEERV